MSPDQQDAKLQKLRRMIDVAAKSSAQGVMTIAAAGAIYTLFPGNLEAIAFLSPVLARFVETVGGNVLAGMMARIGALNDPTPQQIEAILQETAQQTQAAVEKLDRLPDRRVFFAVIEALDKKQDERQQELLVLLQYIVNQLQQVEAAFDTQVGLEYYRQRIQKWHNNLRVLSVEKPLTAIYTDVYLMDKRRYARQAAADMSEHERQFAERKGDYYDRDERRVGQDLLLEEERLFVLGRPGAGKTTFLRWLALQAAQNELKLDLIPIYVELKELAVGEESVEELLALQFQKVGFPQAAAQHFLAEGLREGRFLLLLDGLDEVARRRELVELQIERLAQTAQGCRLVVTCREFAQARFFERFTYVKVADFTSDQIKAFIRNWFTDDKTQGGNLIQAITGNKHKAISELTNQPLLLALLCIAYEEGQGALPAKRHLLYEKALAAVLASWDDTRGVKRRSVYGQLSREKREELLAYVAYHTFEQGKLFFEREILAVHLANWLREWRQKEIQKQKEEYGAVYPPELPPKEIDAGIIIQEIAAQHGLLVEQREGVYSFSHLTLQEYYAARYIVDNEARGMLPRLTAHVGDARWREIFLLTASMLADAVEFSQRYLAALQNMIASEAEIVILLKWSSGKSTTLFGALPKQSRVLYIYAAARTRTHIPELDFTRSDTLDLDLGFIPPHALNRDLDRSYARIRTFARDLDRNNNRIRTLARNLDRNNNRIRDLELILDPDHALDHALDHARDYARDLDRDPDLNRTLSLVRSLLLTRSLTRNLVLVRAFALDLLLLTLLKVAADLPDEAVNDKNLQMAVAHYRPTLIALSQKLSLPTLAQALDSLPWPDENGSAVDLNAFNRQLRAVALEHRDVGHQWKLSREQWALLADYLEANRLLVECLQVATLPDRAAVEAQLLLPPA